MRENTKQSDEPYGSVMLPMAVTSPQEQSNFTEKLGDVAMMGYIAMAVILLPIAIGIIAAWYFD